MRQNAARRTQLLNAAIELLAREGARGLSYRALDAETNLPTGTASNYFRSRNELLGQVAQHIHTRLQPEEGWLNQTLQMPSGPELLTELLQNLVQRVLTQRSVYLALLELRLEATRHPELQAALFETIQENLRINQEFSRQHDMLLTTQQFTLIYLGLSGLLVEELTLPGVLQEDAQQLVKVLVEQFLPKS